MSSSFYGPAGAYNSISGANQDALVRDQQAALQAGYSWTPQGWQEKETQKVGYSGSGGGGGSGGASLINANYRQEDYDPWSKYRAAAGDRLNTSSQNDPSDVYRNRLEQMMTGGASDFTTSDPSYQFRLEQGQKATERSLASKGLLNSGNAAAALQDYGQNAASTEFQAQFGRLMEGMSGVSKQYDMQQQRLMKMAGIDNDPTAAAKLGLQAESINTDRITAANNYSVGMTNAANDRYATDVGASTTKGSASYRSSGGGGGTSFDTKSLFAGKAERAVYSANWWDKQENKSGLSFA
jgi:hypothetical protein